jgi:hypothetical protein
MFIVLENCYLLTLAEIRGGCLCDRPNCWGCILGPYLEQSEGIPVMAIQNAVGCKQIGK